MKNLDYIEILCIKRGDTLKTGRGAAGATYAETYRLFQQARKFEVLIVRATFLVDLRDPKGDLVEGGMSEHHHPRDPRPGELDVSATERRAIERLRRATRNWPNTILVFASGSSSLSIRKIPPDGTHYDCRWEVDSIAGVRNDGGDGGRE